MRRRGIPEVLLSKDTVNAERLGSGADGYRPAARAFHWLTVVLVATQLPIGLYMVYRGPGLNVWDAVTNTLYATHKLLGVTILLLVAIRLGYRLVAGAPAPEPTLAPWQKIASVLNHWSLYALLLTVPALGYVAICYFPALNIVGGFSLPAIVAPDRARYDAIIEWHEAGALTLLGLITLHIAAVVYHRFIRRDGVLARMLRGRAD